MIINTKKFKYKTISESNLDLDLRRHEGHCERVHAFCKKNVERSWPNKTNQTYFRTWQKYYWKQAKLFAGFELVSLQITSNFIF